MPPRSSLRAAARLSVFLTLSCFGSASLATVEDSAGLEGSLTFSLPLLNGSYEDVVPRLSPIRHGALTIRPSVPNSTLQLKSHRIVIVRTDIDRFDVLLDITLSGMGNLSAELSLGGAETTLSDRVTLPEQSLRIPGIVRLAMLPEGLQITTVELPLAITVDIQSALGSRLLSSCRTLLSLLPVGCSGLESTLSRIRVPLETSGESYLIPAQNIDAEIQQQLRFLLGEPNDTSLEGEPNDNSLEPSRHRGGEESNLAL